MTVRERHALNPQTGGCRGPALIVLLGLVAAGCFAGYLLLRIPEVRESFLALVPHRPRIEMTMQRRLLAPRSLFFAGAAAGAVLMVSMAVRPLRRTLFTAVPAGQRLPVVFVALQGAVAFAVVVNLHALYLRVYQRPLWRIGEEEVMARSLPQVWHLAQELKETFPEGARLAVRIPPDDLSNASGHKFMLHSFAYPVALFDLAPATEDWRNDPAFIEAARRYRLNYILDLRQTGQAGRDASPALEPFQWELSGWRR